MRDGIHIGADKDAILAARKAVLDILNVRADQETIREGLRAFTKVCEVGNATVMNCVVNGSVDRGIKK